MSNKGLEQLADTISPEKVYELEATETWSHSFHVFDQRSLLAIDAARAAKRPLLVRGEPGTGKSQLARAAAHILGSHFISKVIDAQTQIEDLWFHYDAVKRLGEAQLLGATQKDSPDLDVKLELKRFIIPGPMWWAFDKEDAAKHFKDAQLAERGYATPLFQQNSNAISKEHSVLLLDEIDKADADLANSLLETLGNGAFRVNMLGKTIGANNSTSTCSLVVITSNDERHLPPAFLRRCVVLKLTLPKSETKFCKLLCKRGKQHHQDEKGNSTISHDVLNKAAQQLWEDRQRAETKGVSLPGQAEYLDMLSVLVEHAENPEKQLSLLEKVREFVFQKHDVLKVDGSQNKDGD